MVAFRSGAAVGVLGGLLGAGFFASLFGPMFRWPGWILHLSPFDAFGTPYSAVTRPGGMALLAALALVGLFAAAVIAHRRPSLT